MGPVSDYKIYSCACRTRSRLYWQRRNGLLNTHIEDGLHLMTNLKAELPLELNLDDVLSCLQEALRVANDLHGTHTRVDDRRQSNAHLAAISNDLRRISDLAQIASGEASIIYWTVKGNADPRGRS